MINVKDFKGFSFVFNFGSADQMRDFFADPRTKECFPKRTAAYLLCANNTPCEDLSITEQNDNVYVVKNAVSSYSEKSYTIDLKGKISSKDSCIYEHRQLQNSKLVLEFPNILETLAKKYPDSSFYGIIHDTDFDWWETTITYEYKDGVLEIIRDGYSEDGPGDSDRKAEIVINIR